MQQGPELHCSHRGREHQAQHLDQVLSDLPFYFFHTNTAETTPQPSSFPKLKAPSSVIYHSNQATFCKDFVF